MKQATHTRPITIYLSEVDFQRVKQITDVEMISLAEWFRDAAKMKLEHDEQKGVTNEN